MLHLMPLFARRGAFYVLTLLLLGSCEDWPPASNTQQAIDVPKTILREQDLAYNGKRLVLTKHARCRMDCREIDAYEVQEIINLNNINRRKSQPASNGRCESLAYEGRTRDGQRTRIVVGDCIDDPIVITVIDLDTKHQCSCK